MTYHFDDVALFPSFCADPTADNCFEFADGALPVFLESDGDGKPVLTTDHVSTTGAPERPYGLLYVLHDREGGDHTVVVRC